MKNTEILYLYHVTSDNAFWLAGFHFNHTMLLNDNISISAQRKLFLQKNCCILPKVENYEVLHTSDDMIELQFHMMNEADRLHRFIDRRIPNSLQNKLAADDILQEVWLAAFHGYSDFHALQDDSIERWLTRIAERKLLDALKRVRRLKRGGRHCVDLSLSRQQSSHIEFLSLITGNQRTPSSEVAAREATRAVQIALNTLPDKYRQAITLCHLDGYSHEEAAKVMRKSVASIHSLIYRAKLKLGQKLGHSDRFFNNYS